MTRGRGPGGTPTPSDDAATPPDGAASTHTAADLRARGGSRRPRVLPGAASTSVREVLTGADADGRVLGVYPTSAYVGTERTVVALLGPTATRLPNGVVVTDTALFGVLRVGESAVVGRGRVRVGATEIRVARWWSVRPRRPVADPGGLAGRAARLRDAAGPPPVDPDRVAACATTDAEALSAAAYGLLGLGPGLTPSGDDVVAGVLVGLRRLGLPGLADAVAPAVVSTARRRTTAVSAALLAHAARGEAASPALDVVDALAGHGDLEATAAALFTLGHTSGRDLAAGLALAAGLVADTAAPAGDGTPGAGEDTAPGEPAPARPTPPRPSPTRRETP